MMARSVWEYFEERKLECEKLGLDISEDSAYAEELGSSGKRGRINARITLTDRAYLQVSEVVVVRANSIHREEYAYYLIIDGQEYWARDFDAIHGYHGHEAGHRRVRADRVTFKQMITEVWEIISAEEELTGTEPPDEGG